MIIKSREETTVNRYHIVDPRPIRDANPHSFHLPCQARLDAIAADDFVKAIFEPTDGGGGERMWIKIESTDGDVLQGTLANEPFGDMALRIEDGYVDRLKDPQDTILVRDGDGWCAQGTVH